MNSQELLFSTLPGIDTAVFRVYRQSVRESVELIITGTLTRDQPAVRVLPPVMRAMLCGFHFRLENGVLNALEG
jgi:hypothetical protein